jgi:hypothetical protein
MSSWMMDDGNDVGSSASSSSFYQSPAPAPAPADKQPDWMSPKGVHTWGYILCPVAWWIKGPDKTPNDYYGSPVGCNFCETLAGNEDPCYLCPVSALCDVGFLIMWLGTGFYGCQHPPLLGPLSQWGCSSPSAAVW